MSETFKRRSPDYTFRYKKHMVGFCDLKSYSGLWFYHDLFLTDKAGVLINASEVNTKALRL